MAAYGVSLDELLMACEGANGNSSGGFMSEFGNEYVVRGMGRTSDLAELGKSVVKATPQGVVKIEDVAALQIGAAPKIGDGSLRGKPAVILTVQKQPATRPRPHRDH